MKASESFLLHGEMVELGSKKDGDYQCAFVGTIVNINDGSKEIIVKDDPEFTVYVTKPNLRVNTIKKECIKKSDCDAYRTRFSNLTDTLYNAIHNPGKYRPVFGFVRPKELLSNPYVYGADIDYGVRLKYAFNKANKGQSPLKYNVGHLDIETDVTGTEQIILITFMNGDGNTYVGVLKEFFTKDVVIEASDTSADIAAKRAKAIEKKTAEVDALWKKTEREFRDKLSDEAKEIYDPSDPVKIHLKVCDTEAQLIYWIFDNINRCKPDFVTIWNIAYDIPYILNRCKFRGIDPVDIFCHPDVPSKWRRCFWKQDKGKKDYHVTDFWHWLHCTGYTIWIDSMCLYGRLRKAKGRDSSYRLNDIGEKEIGAGKLEFGDGEGHYTMQMKHQVAYTVYNIVDVLILRVMELKNNDILNLVMLSGDSMMDEFHHQSVQLKNSFYVYLDGRNMIPGAVGNQLDQPWDIWLDNRGGAVLDPDRSFENIAVPSVEESVQIGRVSRFVLDEDVTSILAS